MHSSEYRSAQLTRQLPPSMLLAHATKLKLQHKHLTFTRGRRPSLACGKPCQCMPCGTFPPDTGCSHSFIIEGTACQCASFGIFVVQAAVTVVTKVGSACLWYRPCMAGHDKHLSSLIGCCRRRKSTRFWARDADMPRAPHDSSTLSAPRTAGKVAAVVYACVCWLTCQGLRAKSSFWHMRPASHG